MRDRFTVLICFLIRVSFYSRISIRKWSTKCIESSSQIYSISCKWNN